MTSLFAHIVPLYGKTEVVATEALKYILEQSEEARRALEQMLATSGVEIGSLTRFQTEAPGDEGERVDLVCYDASGDERVLIEAKFWAGLTDNQPNTYLGRLPEDGPSVLLFVAPAQRIETLWPELRRRAQEKHELTILSDSGDFRSATTNGDHHRLMLTSWRVMLNRMASHASSDAKITADIQQLHGLTARMDADAFLPLHADELGPAFARRMLQLPQLIDDATDRARSAGWVSTERLARTPLATGYGRYMQLAGVYSRFDVNFDHWANLGDTPLWLNPYNLNGLDEDQVLRRLRALEDKGAILGDDWYIPISIPTGVEYDAVLEAVVDQLERIGRLIDPKGPTYNKDSSDA